MSNFYYDNTLNGFGSWFGVQTQEEHAHAMLFVKYMQNNGAKVVLESIAKPDIEFKVLNIRLMKLMSTNCLSANQLTKVLRGCVWRIRTSKDSNAISGLVCKEQGEEEKNVEELCKRFDMFGTDPRGLYMLDNELSARTFVAPSLVI